MHYSENSLTIITNNQTVSYIDEGPPNSPTIIFIHGFPLNKAMWNKQVGELKGNYRVIAYDIRGHGNSDAGDDDFSIELFVNDLLSLMNALKIDKTTLCGFSMGGYIALNAIENYPERSETCSKLHQIKVPVLIMVGKEDEITPSAVALSMHEKIKGSTIHIIDHAGHLINIENSKEFNNRLTEFLSLIKHN